MTRRPGGYSASDEESEEAFLARWSRRKHEAKLNPNTDEPEIAEAAPAGHDSPPDAPPLTDADMPEINTIHGDSDVAGFLSPGVSEELRKMALRRVFHAAAFNVTDGLDDYDEDFTRFEKLGDIITSDMRHQLEMEEERRRAALAGDGLEESEATMAEAGLNEESSPEEEVEQIETSSEEVTESGSDIDGNRLA